MGSLFKKKAPSPPPGDGWAGEGEAAPYDRNASMETARRLFAQGNLDKAEAEYRKVLTDNGDDVEGLRGLAEVSEKKGFRQSAILVYNKLLAIDPNDAEAKQKLKALMGTG